MMKRPFIKLFRTPNSWYFYDVAKSELCQIQPDSYLFLQRLLDGDVVSEPPDELVHLAEMGYLTAKVRWKSSAIHTAGTFLNFWTGTCAS